MSKCRPRKTVCLNSFPLEFWNTGHVGITHDNHRFPDGEGPHGGFTVSVRVYAGLVMKRGPRLVIRGKK